MKGLLAAAAAETVLVAYRDSKDVGGLPLPSTFTSVAVVYGGLGLLPDSAAGFAALVGWGLVVATALNLWSPSNPTALGRATAPAPSPPAQKSPTVLRGAA